MDNDIIIKIRDFNENTAWLSESNGWQSDSKNLLRTLNEDLRLYTPISAIPDPIHFYASGIGSRLGYEILFLRDPAYHPIDPDLTY